MKMILKSGFCWAKFYIVLGILILLIFCSFVSAGQIPNKVSINPGINKNFENPDVKEFLKKFESDDRGVHEKRHKIVELLGLTPGSYVADIGAGTGFLSFLMADKVGPDGIVYAIDIAKNFIDYIQEKALKQGKKNIHAIVNTHKSTLLKDNSVDAILIVDTYHHFEYPFEMLASIRKALRPDGILLIVDFERIEGKTEEWILKMVRAGKGHFTDEIIDAGFQLIEEIPFTKDHYILRFKKDQCLISHDTQSVMLCIPRSVTNCVFSLAMNIDSCVARRLHIMQYALSSRLAIDVHCSPKNSQLVTDRGINL